MEKLSFHYREDPKPYMVMLFVLTLLSSGFWMIDASVSVSYGPNFAPWTAHIARSLGFPALYPWYRLMTILKKSLNDNVIEIRISWAFCALIFLSFAPRYFGDISNAEEWNLIYKIANWIFIILYALIGVRCIMAGDSKVTRFGIYLICIGILLSGVLIEISEIILPKFDFHTPGWFLFISVVALSSLCYIYPFYYMRKAMKESSAA